VTFLTLGVLLALAAYGAVGCAGALVAAGLWRGARRQSSESGGACRRARGLFIVRVLPAAAGALMVGGLVVPAFSAFEPRETEEVVGRTVLVVSAFGSLLLAGSAWRILASVLATRALAREWMRTGTSIRLPDVRIPAYRIETPFPVISVVGFVRPRLFVAGQVLEACPPRELSAILAHEHAHVKAFDNLKRLLMRCAPDVLGWLPAGRSLEKEWSAAAEEAADERASSHHAARLDLAHALIRVARLTPPGLMLDAPATAFYRGESIERRVRRLVAGCPPASGRPLWLSTAWTLLLVLPVLALAGHWHPEVLPNVHELLEVAVTHLP
jgi:Zn-dependent protease with chaperone function